MVRAATRLVLHNDVLCSKGRDRLEGSGAVRMLTTKDNTPPAGLILCTRAVYIPRRALTEPELGPILCTVHT